MHGKEEHGGIVQKDGLRPIAVMHVPIDNEYLLHVLLQFGPSVRGGNGDIVNEAVSSRHTGFGVMAGRANYGKAVVDFALNGSFCQRAKSPGRLFGFLQRLARQKDGLVLLGFAV